MELPINQIMNGDCLLHLKELPDNSVDAIIIKLRIWLNKTFRKG